MLLVVVVSSLWSPKMRCRKSETISGRPFRRDILGSQPSRSFAFVISGFLLCGSSSVLGLNSILAFGSMVSWTTYTNQKRTTSLCLLKQHTECDPLYKVDAQQVSLETPNHLPKPHNAQQIKVFSGFSKIFTVFLY